MKLQAFEHLLDRCGGDPAGWPPGARAGAARLLVASASARELLRVMQDVERGLSAPAPAPIAGLAEQVMTARQLGAPSPLAIPAFDVRWAAAAAAALMLGVATGWLNGAGEDPAQTLASALSAPTEAVDAS
jgi:hypothetical protein